MKPHLRKQRFLKVSFLVSFLLIFCATAIPQNSYAVDGEITYTGTDTNLIGDDVSAGPFNIGFTFPFYGTDFTQIYVNINGTMGFGGNYNRYSNVPLNTAISGTNIADNTIYPFWDDLNTNGTRNIYYATVGDAPNRKFVAQWTNIFFHGTQIQLGTFQAILYEGTNVVQLQYRDLLGGDRALGNSATIGLRKNNSLSHQYSHNTASLTQEQAIRYTPDGSGSYTVNTNAPYELVYLAPEGAPTSPTLVNPTDGTTGVTLTPTFEWLPVESATSYTVLISTVSNFSSTVVNQSGITGTSYTPGSALGQNTNYYWRVQSVNANGSSLSPTRSFTTGSLNTAPNTPADVASATMIGGASSGDLNGATLTATLTDDDPDEQVRYRIQIATDSNFSELVIDYRSAFADEGAITYTFGENGGTYLVGESSTVLAIDDYYLRIRAEDDAAASSAWHTVSGIAFSIIEAPDTDPPIISSISVTAIDTTSATITWTTDEVANSQVEYGTTSSYGDTEASAALVTSHSIELTNLQSATTYHYRVQSADEASNTATSTDLTFTTATPPDVTAPGISEISVDPEDTSATIFWITDEDASSMVEYGPSSTYVTSTIETNTDPRVTEHEIIITGLEACVTYHYRVVSRDASGNEVLSNNNSFTTKGCVGQAVVVAQNASTVDRLIGGSVDLRSGGLGIALSVPPSFSANSAHFQIKKVDDTAARTLVGTPSGKAAAGAYTYELHAVTDDMEIIESFDEPITLTLAYAPSDVEGIVETSLRIYRWHNAQWIQLPDCVVDSDAKTVTCSTDHFSTFGLFGEGVVAETRSTRRTGTSVTARVHNLIKMGNIEAAEDLKKQFPNAFKETTLATLETPAEILDEKDIDMGDTLMTSTPEDVRCSLPQIDRVLRNGSVGEDVRSLQQFLNCAGFTLDVAGAGSPGNETTVFSVKTYNALVKFQDHYASEILIPLGLMKGTGIFGESTKKKVASM